MPECSLNNDLYEGTPDMQQGLRARLVAVEQMAQRMRQMEETHESAMRQQQEQHQLAMQQQEEQHQLAMQLMAQEHQQQLQEHQQQLQALKKDCEAAQRAAQAKIDRLATALTQVEEVVAPMMAATQAHRHFFRQMGVTKGCEAARAKQQLDRGATTHMELGKLSEAVAATSSTAQETALLLEQQSRAVGGLQAAVTKFSRQQPSTCVLYADPEAASEQLSQQLAAAAKIPAAVVQVRLLYRPRAAGRLGVWEVAARRDDVRRILGGSTRTALKQAGLRLYVDDMLTPEQRQQRQQLQALRQQLWRQRVRTRWCKAELQQKVQDEQGRWTWQRAQYPTPPEELEEGEVPAGGSGSGGGGGNDGGMEVAT